MSVPKGGIAFFDSGIGGLTVLAECRKRIKNALFYYYGDNRHAPYGNRSERQIKRYVFRVFRKFKRLHVRAVVVACNTVTAVCIEELRKKYAFPILGTEPAVLSACKEGGEVLVLTTKAANQSPRFRALCQRAQEKCKGAKLHLVPCEGLAGAIEAHLLDGAYDYSALLPTGSPNAVVLGCTHYIYLKETIQKRYACTVFDGNEGVAKRLENTLRFQDLGRATTFCPISTRKDKNRAKTRLRRLVKPLYIKANKRSYFSKIKNAEALETSGIQPIFFLGRSKQTNKNIYKQMFVLSGRG